MNVAGYCASSSTDINWHASYISEEECKRCTTCEWVSRHHHLRSMRLLESMSPSEKSMFILMVKSNVTLSSALIESWESQYQVDLSNYIPSRVASSSAGYFYVHVTAGLAAILKGLAFVLDIMPLPAPWKESPLLSEAIRKDVYNQSETADFSTLRVSIGVCSHASLNNTVNLATQWSESLKSLDIPVSVNVDTIDQMTFASPTSDFLIPIVSFVTSQAESLWIEPAMKYYSTNIEASVLLQTGGAR